VDDDPAVLSSLRRLLREEPYDVETSDSVAGGLELIRRRTPAVIISDERMPEANGSEFLAAVRGRWPWIGRILLTAFPGPDIQIRSLRAGVDLLLYKPWDGDSLKKVLRRLLHEVDRAGRGGISGAAEDDPFDVGGEGG